MTELIPFVVHGSTQQAAHGGGRTIVVATDAQRTGLGELGRTEHSGRLFIAVFAGAQRTGGFAVEVERVVRERDGLLVHARFAEPGPGAIVIQVLTSPAVLVSIDRRQAAGVRAAVLVDQKNAEVARGAVPQSQL